MKIRTAELEGAALDWAVAKAGGVDAAVSRVYANGTRHVVTGYYIDHEVDGQGFDGRSYCPSEHWSDGGPIIEREKIWLMYVPATDGRADLPAFWSADIGAGDERTTPTGYGDTALLSAMRCFVESKLGGTVDVPDELVATQAAPAAASTEGKS